MLEHRSGTEYEDIAMLDSLNIGNIGALIERMEKNAYSAYPNHSGDMLEYQTVTDLIRYLERKNIVEYTRR